MADDSIIGLLREIMLALRPRRPRVFSDEAYRLAALAHPEGAEFQDPEAAVGWGLNMVEAAENALDKLRKGSI